MCCKEKIKDLHSHPMSGEHYCHATENSFIMYLGHFTSRLHDIVCKGTAFQLPTNTEPINVLTGGFDVDNKYLSSLEAAFYAALRILLLTKSCLNGRGDNT